MRAFSEEGLVLGWPELSKLARAPSTLWEHSYERLKLPQLLDQLGIFFTLGSCIHFSAF